MGDARCGTCRYWGDAEDLGERWRRCLGVRHGSTRRTEDGPYDVWLDDYGQGPRVILSRAFVADGSDYYAALKCEADFGCVLHEDAL